MNNEIRNTKYEPRFGFTLIELVVAIGIMALVILFASTVFKTSISSYRVAMAQTEIMQKLRAITQQLDSDFRGLRKDAPMFIHFEMNDNYGRFDQIMFFADGDFQSAGQNTIVGNLARIYYGHSQSSYGLQGKDRLFARRQHILTADATLQQWPNFVAGTFSQTDPFTTNPILLKNDTYEYDLNSLSEWQVIANNPTYVDQIINVCFGNNADSNNSRPVINTADANAIHNLMAQGIGSFCVQWGYYCIAHGAYFWWPSTDPNGSGNIVTSDFGSNGMNNNIFGLYLNSAAPTAPANSLWVPYSGVRGYYYPDPSNPVNTAPKPTYPQALKFAFTIFDSRGVFKDGQTFTHIVYLGD
jgi:prepilin-type N-terminal cleavage/methylation domain-containing protein